VEVQKLTTTGIVTHLKAIFAKFGIPTTLVFDNRLQFNSQDMKEFDHAYEFQQTTTNPYYSQVNGLAERMAKTVKKLLEYPADPYKVILSYRATPFPWCGLSPAELLMGRKIRTDVPQQKDKLITNWEHIQNFRTLDEKYKQTQKENYNRYHGVRALPPLPEDQTMWFDIIGHHRTSGSRMSITGCWYTIIIHC